MNAITKHEAMLPAMPEDEVLGILRSSLYPGADPASIKMVLGYCRAAGLDPMQKPVHIVPMWDSKNGQMRDVVMPGVNLYRTQASRSGQMAGISNPEFGPMIAATIGGADITYPEWCRVTVKRLLPGGFVAEFSAIEYWIENYAQKGGKEKSVAPNTMWMKRPRGQIAKCAEAQALRRAFPEIGGAYTAEEMEGKAIVAEEVVNGPAQGDTAAENDPVVAAGREAALGGMAALTAWWGSLTPRQRSALNNEFRSLRKAATLADQTVAGHE